VIMGLYQYRNVPTIEAFPLPDGNYVVIANGQGIITPKAQFEEKYVPFVRQG